MEFLVVVIPVACCVLIPVAIGAVAYLGLGKKNKRINSYRDNEVPQERSQYSTPRRQSRK